MRPLALDGQVFGRLTVLSKAEPKPDGARWWVCKCECGALKEARGADLKRGFTKSCGCLSSEVTARRNLSHGKSDTRLYHIWQAMHERTGNPNADKFHHYGGRGISVCDEWQRFEPFYDWAMANGYEDRTGHPRRERLSIDRIDPDGNYEPSNCRWATQLVQVRNRRPKYQILERNEHARV